MGVTGRKDELQIISGDNGQYAVSIEAINGNVKEILIKGADEDLLIMGSRLIISHDNTLSSLIALHGLIGEAVFEAQKQGVV